MSDGDVFDQTARLALQIVRRWWVTRSQRVRNLHRLLRIASVELIRALDPAARDLPRIREELLAWAAATAPKLVDERDEGTIQAALRRTATEALRRAGHG